MVGNKVSGADGGLSARGAIEYAPKGFGTSSRYRLPLLGFLVLQIRWLPVLQFRREELCDHRKLLGREDEASRSRNFDPNGAAGRAGKILNRALPSTPDFELVYRLKQAPRIRKGTTCPLESGAQKPGYTSLQRAGHSPRGVDCAGIRCMRSSTMCR